MSTNVFRFSRYFDGLVQDLKDQKNSTERNKAKPKILEVSFSYFKSPVVQVAQFSLLVKILYK